MASIFLIIRWGVLLRGKRVFKLHHIENVKNDSTKYVIVAPYSPEESPEAWLRAPVGFYRNRNPGKTQKTSCQTIPICCWPVVL